MKLGNVYGAPVQARFIKDTSVLSPVIGPGGRGVVLFVGSPGVSISIFVVGVKKSRPFVAVGRTGRCVFAHFSGVIFTLLLHVVGCVAQGFLKVRVQKTSVFVNFANQVSHASNTVSVIVM